jgi:2-keto-3-deoxygluconate permease
VPILTALWVRRYQARDALHEEFAGAAQPPLNERDVHV